MRLSAKAQYACVAMLELAANYSEGQLVQVKTIADVHGISQRFLVQILLQLKVNHLVRSIRGAAGGYQLARRPDDISLADIIQAIDQTAAPSSPVLNALKPPAAVQVVGSGARERRHRQPAELKPSPAVQAVGSLLQELDARERQMLAEITLSDLVRRTEQAGAPSYQI